MDEINGFHANLSCVLTEIITIKCKSTYTDILGTFVAVNLPTIDSTIQSI